MEREEILVSNSTSKTEVSRKLTDNLTKITRNPLLTSTVTASGRGGGRSSFDVSTPGVTAACADTLPVPVMVPVVVLPAVPGVPACPVLTLLAVAAAVDDPGTGSAPPDTPSYVACVVLSVFVGASMPVLAGPTLGGSALEGSVVALGVVIRPVAGLACNGGGLLGLFTEWGNECSDRLEVTNIIDKTN